MKKQLNLKESDILLIMIALQDQSKEIKKAIKKEDDNNNKITLYNYLKTTLDLLDDIKDQMK